jgi:amino acid transporter
VALITVAVLISTLGAHSSLTLETPRLIYSLGQEGELPKVLGRLHPQFHTPGIATICFALLVWLLAVSGGFLWLAVVTAAASMIMYISICAALFALRKREPNADALRVPCGPVLSILGIFMSAVLIVRLQTGQALLMGVTMLLAAANWWLVRPPASANEVMQSRPPAPAKTAQ